jgi:glutaredoxin-related protein
MTKEVRDKIFKKAGTRVTPVLFVDDEFVGGYDQVNELDECGKLDKIMQY